ncbi:MAG TPA: hypothetical protein VGY31_03420 [Terriglobia bacterium]|nr:hypothetical protein [Terriglobia bacterium]
MIEFAKYLKILEARIETLETVVEHASGKAYADVVAEVKDLKSKAEAAAKAAAETK